MRKPCEMHFFFSFVKSNYGSLLVKESQDVNGISNNVDMIE